MTRSELTEQITESLRLDKTLNVRKIQEGSNATTVYSYMQDWLLRDDEGNLVPTGPHWSTGYALDTLNVEVRSYVLEVLQTVTQEWGFELVKADFLHDFAADIMKTMKKGQDEE